MQAIFKEYTFLIRETCFVGSFCADGNKICSFLDRSVKRHLIYGVCGDDSREDIAGAMALGTFA